jgi:hypothetical protein
MTDLRCLKYLKRLMSLKKLTNHSGLKYLRHLMNQMKLL